MVSELLNSNEQLDPFQFDNSKKKKKQPQTKHHHPKTKNLKDPNRIGSRQASGANPSLNLGSDTIRADVVPVDERHVAGEISTAPRTRAVS